MVPDIIKIVILSYCFQFYLKLILLWLYLIAISWITSHLGNPKDQKHWITFIHDAFDQFLPSAYWTCPLI